MDYDLNEHLDKLPYIFDEVKCNKNQTNSRYWNTYKLQGFTKGFKQEFSLITRDNESINLYHLATKDEIEESKFCLKDNSSGIFVEGCL